MTSLTTKSTSNRLEYLDWVRGLGAAVMLQGHVFQSYLKPELKQSGPYLLSQFVGGMPPAPLGMAFGHPRRLSASPRNR